MDAVTASLLKEAGIAQPQGGARPNWAAETAAGRAQQPERDALSRAVLTAEGGTDPAARSDLSQEQWSARLGGQPAEPDPVTKALLAEASGKSLTSVPAAKQEPKAAPLVDSTGVRETAAHVVTGVGSSILGGYHGLAALASGGTLDDAVKAVEEAQKRGTYQPESVGGKMGAAAMASPLNPLNWLGMFGKKVGETMQDFGVGPGVATAAEVLVNAAPAALLGRGRTTIGDVAANRTVTPAPASTAALEVTPNLDVPTVIRRRQAATAPAPVPAPEAPAATVAQVAAGQPALPAPAATPAPAPKAQTPTQAALSAPPAGVTAITEAEEAARAAVLRRIGIEGDLRTSALKGDPKGASTDFQMARPDTKGGYEMRSKLDAERHALTNHAEKIIADTGGTAGLDQKVVMARGGTILRPLDSFKTWFDDNIHKLYVEADARAKGVPTTLQSFGEVLGNQAVRTNSERVHLQSAARSYAQEIGLLQEDGSFAGTAQQAETMRKYLNENWSHQNSGLVSKLKDALDNDVMKAAGEDIYAKARAMRAMRGATLDNPNGIAKIMDASGPNEINRSVPVERIADTIAAMPVEQLRHIISTLDTMPPELKAQAAAAKAEIKAHFANDLLAEGNKNAVQWNAKNVRAYLDANAAKFEMLFTPEELATINDLRQAGNILHKDPTYPGAAVQQHNLLRTGVMKALPTAGAAAGAAIGGPIGAAAGGLAGEGLAQKFSGSQSLRATKNRFTKIKDVKP